MSRSELAMWDWIYLSPLMMMLNQYYDMPVNEFYLLVCATVSFFFGFSRRHNFLLFLPVATVSPLKGFRDFITAF